MTIIIANIDVSWTNFLRTANKKEPAVNTAGSF